MSLDAGTVVLTNATGLVGRLICGGLLHLTGAGAPSNGTSGTAAGDAAPGSIYIDTTNAIEYINTGTQAAPVWNPTGSAVDAVRNVSNASGGTISAGQLVALSGWDETNQMPKIVKADADADLPADYVLPADILTGHVGIAKQTFRLTAQNTNGFTVGDPVYLSATAGGWTHTAPTAANAIQQVVGRVAVVSLAAGVVELDVRTGVPAGAVDTNALQAKAVTAAKIALTDTHLLVGSGTGAAADVALSGDATLADTGAMTIGAKAVNPPKMALTHGHVIVGDAGGAGADVAVSGDVTIADTGAVTVVGLNGAPTSVTGTVLDALASAVNGLGSSNAYIKTDVGTKTLLAAHATKNRGVLIVVDVTETFADGGGTQPTATIGEAGGAADAGMLVTALVNATAGTRFIFGWNNTSTRAITATLVAKIGAGTGGFSVLVIALPNS